MRYQFILMFLLLLTAGYVSAGKIYTWKDAEGQVHFSSTPPPQVDAKSTGLTTGVSGFNNPPPQTSSAYSHQPSNAAKPFISSTLEEQKKGGAEFSKMMQDSRRRDAERAKANFKLKKPNNWQQEVIDKCKANRGVNCSDSRYVQSKRPLTAAERDELNRVREERRNRAAIERANRSCIGGGC